jgi:hypothetical protein
MFVLDDEVHRAFGVCIEASSRRRDLGVTVNDIGLGV